MPGCRACAAYAASTTIPLKSLPKTIGIVRAPPNAPVPVRVVMSMGFTPAAITLTSTSELIRVGRSITAIFSTSGDPGSVIVMARIVVIVGLPAIPLSKDGQ
jgi:hypothetical protein